MNKINNLLLLLWVVVFSSCKETPAVEQDKEATTTEKKNFEMYNMSEMALLMEQMYVDNERLKNRIINGEEVGEFPTHFSKIHSSIFIFYV